MWIKPLRFSVNDETVIFGDLTEVLPLPPWSGVPVALDMEVERDTLDRLVRLMDVGTLQARDEDGDLVHCAALVDAQGSHTCETDTVLRLVQCGPFEFEDDDRE